MELKVSNVTGKIIETTIKVGFVCPVCGCENEEEYKVPNNLHMMGIMTSCGNCGHACLTEFYSEF